MKHINVRVGKYLPVSFPFHNGLKKGDALSPLLFNFALECAIRKVQKNHMVLNLNGCFQFMLMMRICWEVTCLLQRKYTNFN
jgi:hypothetical protein